MPPNFVKIGRIVFFCVIPLTNKRSNADENIISLAAIQNVNTAIYNFNNNRITAAYSYPKSGNGTNKKRLAVYNYTGYV